MTIINRVGLNRNLTAPEVDANFASLQAAIAAVPALAPPINDLTTGGSSVSLSAEMGKTLQANKADIRVPVAISASTALTASAHADRTLLISGSGIVLTINNDATSGASGAEVFYAIPVGAATFTMAAGTATVTAPSGTSLDTATAVGGAVMVQRNAANTYKAESPIVVASSAKYKCYGLDGTPASITTGGGNNQTSAKITVPANVFPINGKLKVTAVWSRAGTTDTLGPSIRVSAGTATAFISATQVCTSVMVAATVRHVTEVQLQGNRADRTTMYYQVTQSSGVAGSYTSANAPAALTLDTTAQWQIQFGGNAGATDAWQLMTAVAEISDPDA